MIKVDDLIKEIDEKISKLEKEENKKQKLAVNDEINIIRDTINELNAVDDLKAFRDSDIQNYNDMILTIVGYFKYIERNNFGSEEHKNAKKIVMSLGEKHPILYDWCKDLVGIKKEEENKKEKV